MIAIGNEGDDVNATGRMTQAWPGAGVNRATPIVISTDAFAPDQRFDVWRDSFARLNDVQILPDLRPGFTAESRTWRLGSLFVGANRTPARRLVRTRLQCVRDGVDHWVLRVLVSGRTVIRRGDAVDVVGPGDLYLLSLADSYVDDWTDGAWVSLIIPRDAYPLLATGLSQLRSGPVRGVRAALLADHLRALAARLDDAAEAELPAIGEGTRALLSACLLADTAPGAVTPQESHVLLRERVRRVIRANIGSARLDPNRICELAGVSRSALYRLFDAEGGVANHLRELRLGYVHADLTDPALAQEPIARIAERWGFFSVSSFNRAFRRTFGITPGEARMAALLGTPPAATVTPVPPLAPDDFLSLLRDWRSSARAPQPTEDG